MIDPTIRKAIEKAFNDPNPNRGQKEVFDKLVEEYGELYATWFTAQLLEVKIAVAWHDEETKE